MIRALLTIDDIPSDNTCTIVDYLNEAGIQAIMFAVGEKAEKNPEPVVYAVKHGMIVGNHSYSHPHFSELSLSEGIREIDRCEAVLTRIYDMAASAVERLAGADASSLDVILEADAAARRFVHETAGA